MPYVLSHGRWPHGSDWLMEAAVDCYIPLLDALNGLVEQGISPKTVVGISPVLAEQLANPTFVTGLFEYLQSKIESAGGDADYFASDGQPRIAELARRSRDHYTQVFARFRRTYDRSLTAAFKSLQDAGHVEIASCGATHGYFPLLSRDTSIQAQVKQAVSTHKKHFGRSPKGFWLPECAYRPSYEWSYPVDPADGSGETFVRNGVEEFLAENGIRYFITEEHMLQGTTSLGDYGDKCDTVKGIWDRYNAHFTPDGVERSNNTPYLVRSRNGIEPEVAVFARDPKIAGLVWCPTGGYPADEWYREFHKQHFPSGHRYWRVSGMNVDLDAKHPYEPERASERTQAHAEHFVSVVKESLRAHLQRFGEPGVVCAAYDTELFGHWWSEGVDWLKRVIELMARDPEIELSTGSECLEANPPTATVALPEGSWGQGGFHWVWMNPDTKWTWELIYSAEAEMSDLAREFGRVESARRALKQAARELLVLQASDWQFNISTGGSGDYSEQRVKEHYGNFERLAGLVRQAADGQLSQDDLDFLEYCEQRTQLFEETDPQWFVRLDRDI
jgi:1,4-alpha-glucan branching enzyme